MVKLILVTGLVVTLLFGIAAAQEPGDLGLGIILGEPTGLTAKVWVEEEIGLVAAAGWSIEKKEYFHLHGDYLFHDFDTFKVEKGKLAFYYGPGIRVKLSNSDKTKLGIRAVGGLDYIFGKHPLDIFFELVLLVNVVPKTESDLNCGIGVIYYFH